MSCHCCQRSILSAIVTGTAGYARGCGFIPEGDPIEALYPERREHQPTGLLESTHTGPLYQAYGTPEEADGFECPTIDSTFTEGEGEGDNSVEILGEPVTLDILASAAQGAAVDLTPTESVLYDEMKDAWWNLMTPFGGPAATATKSVGMSGTTPEHGEGAATVSTAKIVFNKRGHPVPVRVLFDVVQTDGVTVHSTTPQEILILTAEWASAEFTLEVTHPSASIAQITNFRCQVPARE